MTSDILIFTKFLWFYLGCLVLHILTKCKYLMDFFQVISFIVLGYKLKMHNDCKCFFC